jgi:hypothetical protein
MVDNRYQQEAFPFLNLPKDLRLMIYDCLLERKHQISSLYCPKSGAKVNTVFTTSNSIPPIHVTCKMLYAEAGPFLKAKVTRMSLPHATAQVTINAVPIKEDTGLRIALKTLFQGIHSDLYGRHGRYYEYPSTPADMLWENESLEEYRSYEKEVTSFAAHAVDKSITANGPYALMNWREEVDYELHGIHKSFTCGYQIHTRKIRELADQRASLPGGKSKGLHLAVRGSHPDFNMQNFLLWLLGWNIRIFVHAIGETHKDVVFSDDWVRYEGTMSEKTWREEWM